MVFEASAAFLQGLKQEYEREMVLTARARSIILDSGWVSASVRIQESCRDRPSARLHDAGF